MNFDLSFVANDPELNGSNGIYRANKQQNIAKVDTDQEAVNAFLREYQHSPATFRTYSKEAQRVLMWANLYLGKPLSSMDREDFHTYMKFMANPDPEWVGKKVNKDTGDWRPFTGPLSESGKKTAVASINSMMTWLVNAGYLVGNPMGLIRQRSKKTSKDDVEIERFLDDDMWSALLTVVETMETKTKGDRFVKERMRFMLTTFALLGARVSEISTIQMGHFRHTVNGWFWYVTGKGDKDARVAMPQGMVDGLIRWREFIGLPPVPDRAETYPALVFSDKSGNPLLDKPPIKPRRINQILKSFFEKASAELIAGGQRSKAHLIKKASAHWLRHTSITQKVNAGIERDIVRMEARHSDSRTTDGYVHNQSKERANQAQKHKINWSN